MRYRYLVDLRRGISVFAIFSYGIAVLGTPKCPPPHRMTIQIYVDVTAEPSAIYWLYLVFEISGGSNTLRCVGVTKRPVTLSVSYALSRIDLR